MKREWSERDGIGKELGSNRRTENVEIIELDNVGSENDIENQVTGVDGLVNPNAGKEGEHEVMPRRQRHKKKSAR